MVSLLRKSGSIYSEPKHRFSHLIMQMDRLFIHADYGLGWIIGSLVDCQNIFHRGDKVRVLFGRDDPLLSGMRLEFVFL